MSLTYQSLQIDGHYDDGGTLHWRRTPPLSPIMAVAGAGLRDDALPVEEVIEAAGYLGWSVTEVDDSGDGCTINLSRPDART